MDLTSMWVTIIVIYPIPTIIAWARRSDHARDITAISLLLGWLPLVTIGCAIWAIVDKTEQKQAEQAARFARAIRDTR